MKRGALVLALGALISGCDRADVEACEAHVGRQLAAPSTYRRVNVTDIDTPNLSFDEIVQKAGLPRLGRHASPIDVERRQLLKDYAAPGRSGLREMVVEYEAENNAGVPIRAFAGCAFLLVDGKTLKREALMQLVDRATSDSLAGRVHELTGKLPAPPARRYACCLE